MIKVPENVIDLAGHRIFARDLDGAKAEKKGYARRRTFLVALNPEEAESLARDGWPVDYLEPNNPEEEGIHFLKVFVAFGKNNPPKVVILNPFTKRKQTLNENTISQLNWISIQDIPDMYVRPFKWQKAGKEGVHAYLNGMHVLKKVDPFDEKFSEYVEESDDGENDYD